MKKLACLLVIPPLFLSACATHTSRRPEPVIVPGEVAHNAAASEEHETEVLEYPPVSASLPIAYLSVAISSDVPRAKTIEILRRAGESVGADAVIVSADGYQGRLGMPDVDSLRGAKSIIGWEALTKAVEVRVLAIHFTGGMAFYEGTYDPYSGSFYPSDANMSIGRVENSSNPAMKTGVFVKSPYAPDEGYINVTGLPKGTKYICPYTGIPFILR